MFEGTESNGGAAGDERMSPSVRPKRRMEVGVAGMRVAGGRKEKVCLNQHNFFFLFEGDVRNWDSSGIADVPGLSMPQTQDSHTHTHRPAHGTHAHTNWRVGGGGARRQQTRTFARKEVLVPLGTPPAFKTMPRRISMH